jgi:hypothetical protein
MTSICQVGSILHPLVAIFAYNNLMATAINENFSSIITQSTRKNSINLVLHTYLSNRRQAGKHIDMHKRARKRKRESEVKSVIQMYKLINIE